MATHSETAYVTLRDRIISGQYPADHRLNESALAEELHISRTPLREAVQRLVADGLVVAKPHKRARVVGWSVERMFSTYTIRASLEARAAALAAERCTQADVAQLVALADQMEASHAAGGTSLELAALNREFHMAIARTAEDEALQTVIESVSVQPMLLFAKEHLGHGYRQRVHHQHRDIIEALRTNDPDWASAAMRSHILAGRNAGCIAPTHIPTENTARRPA